MASVAAPAPVLQFLLLVRQLATCQLSLWVPSEKAVIPRPITTGSLVNGGGRHTHDRPVLLTPVISAATLEGTAMEVGTTPTHGELLQTVDGEDGITDSSRDS